MILSKEKTRLMGRNYIVDEEYVRELGLESRDAFQLWILSFAKE